MVEQNSMCHAVSVMGYGKPENASNHLLKRMTEMEMDIHDSTYEYDLRTCIPRGTAAGMVGLAQRGMRKGGGGRCGPGSIAGGTHSKQWCRTA